MDHLPMPTAAPSQPPAAYDPLAFAWWIADPDCPGAARPVQNLAELERLAAAGVPFYNSPAGCVLHAGVQASAFARPLVAEDVWNGADILANNFSLEGLAPCGRRASYRVVATPGRATPHHPPLWPSEMAAQQAA